MIVDGKRLAEEIKVSLQSAVATLGALEPRLAVIQVGHDPVSEKFLARKKKFGSEVGIGVRVYRFPKDISTDALRQKISQIVHIKQNAAVIIQLPLPQEINTPYILDALISEKDAELLSSKSIGLFVSGRSKALPPVVGAVRHILQNYDVEVRGKRVVVIGSGRLVGKPIAMWMMQQGAALTVLDENTPDLAPHTLEADIIISGVGKPNLVTFDIVKNNSVIIDCGTSEAAGRLVGDISPAVADKAFLFAPVPGGVGPLTVAMLFANVVMLARA